MTRPRVPARTMAYLIRIRHAGTVQWRQDVYKTKRFMGRRLHLPAGVCCCTSQHNLELTTP